MHKILIKVFVAGLFLALVPGGEGVAQSSKGLPDEPCVSGAFKAQESRLLDRETRAEERSEALRARLFDLQMEEIDLLARLDDLDYRLTPESIQRALALVGSVRPMDELREALRIRLEGQKARVKQQLDLLAASRERLESAIREAEAELELVRQR